MIDIIRFKNYRIFRAEQELHLHPVTIVFGKNNTGKSAILKLPILIENILENEGKEIISDSFGMGPVLFTELRDVVYGKATKAVELGISDKSLSASLNLSFFVDSTVKPNSRIEKCKIVDGDIIHQLQWETDELYHIDGSLDVVNIDFNGIKPINHDREVYKNVIEKLHFSTDYIGSVRELPQIDMRMQSTVLSNSGVTGINNFQKLIADALGDNIFAEKVVNWYKDNFDGWLLKVDKSRLPVIHLELEKNGIHTNITETGMGIMQSLPIVIRACAPCDEPTLISIEEPETHLHSSAHASLGELIALSAKEDTNKRYLIETHSKNFILRLRRLIANKQLDIDDVALYYVDFDEKNACSSLRKINIGIDGSVDFWPNRMFDESLQETLAIRTIQLTQ